MEKIVVMTKAKFGIRDIMTAAAMIVLCVAVNMIIGTITLPVPILYLYFSAGMEGFLGAVFYLVVANRINKHGLLLIWSTIFGLIQLISGYAFMLPYFVLLGALAELIMIGENSYRKPVRNAIGWGVYTAGMFIGIAVPLWWAWDSYSEMALNSGFTVQTLDMQLNMVKSPGLMILGSVISLVLAVLGIMFGQRLLRKHFQKAGVV